MVGSYAERIARVDAAEAVEDFSGGDHFAVEHGVTKPIAQRAVVKREGALVEAEIARGVGLRRDVSPFETSEEAENHKAVEDDEDKEHPPSGGDKSMLGD